ncbi:MAG TPA: SDR family oxidoreductase [Acidimicrobiales bacterium]|nr:SDR family oxidoreductase [Acidimicrobiales bacterium]
MSNDLSGRVAIVTGAAQGIGAAIAEDLCRAGASVVIGDVSPQGADTAKALDAATGRARFQPVDVSRADEVTALVDRARGELGGVDILVNCAGIFPIASLEDTTVELWDRVLAVNLRGAFLCAQAVVPEMRRRQGGAIVNIGSMHALGGAPDRVAYAVSKGGLVTLTTNLARSLAPDRIRVNCVHPGWVPTEGERHLRREEGHPDGWLEERGRDQPLGRLQTPADVAGMVSFLVSPAAEQVTGQVVAVSGRPL